MNAICRSRLASNRPSNRAIPSLCTPAPRVSAITLSRIAAHPGNILFRFGLMQPPHFLADLCIIHARTSPPISSSLLPPHVKESVYHICTYIYIYVCSDFSPGNLRRFLPHEYLSTRFYRCLRIGGKEER